MWAESRFPFYITTKPRYGLCIGVNFCFPFEPDSEAGKLNKVTHMGIPANISMWASNVTDI